MEKLISFFENAPLEEVTAKLKVYGVEFTTITSNSGVIPTIIPTMNIVDMIRKKDKKRD